ncbi:hypothetical protein HBI26_202650 [Parastagonospora nodorum]|nr:hypothetical protein HBI10_141180 [Parastagonospora nodorum]KAH4020972.1 hypothetical protein HBI13_109480 [Parastagonospora nodorum]KAH4898928.1 hypothetical protein HBH74_187400 [Parastagonospora nodorum]KAH4947247.1 hypothetical protein HBH73_135370 [Parastagonospora nodorum]KAH5090318.1 hypothetical protein HBH72_218510 [Parastagonospora nodorum]
MATGNSSHTGTAWAPALIGVAKVRVVEASDTKDYFISELLLEKRTPSFAKLVCENTGDGGIFEVTECQITTFDIFTVWLNAEPECLFSPLSTNPIGDHFWISGVPLIQLHIFAGDYNIPELAEDALRRFASLVHLIGGKTKIPHVFAVDIYVFPTLEEIGYVYSNTSAESPLRPIIVNAFCTTDQDLGYSLMDAHREFLVDVIIHMQGMQDKLKGVMGFIGLSDVILSEVGFGQKPGSPLDMDGVFDLVAHGLHIQGSG